METWLEADSHDPNTVLYWNALIPCASRPLVGDFAYGSWLGLFAPTGFEVVDEDSAARVAGVIEGLALHFADAVSRILINMGSDGVEDPHGRT